MDTYTHVRDAFYSGGHAFTGDKQTVKDISFLVDEHYLKLRIFHIASRQEYLEMLHNIERNKSYNEAVGGSKEHIALKLLSGEYMQKKLGLEVLYEHPLCGYYPDVVTVNNRIVVECGHTNNPEKMLIYFRQSDITECICVPYPDPDAQNIQAYSFSASEKLRDFLAFWESEKRAEVLKKLGR